ncbi:hypothetical protein GIB23_14305 [Pseudomonas putida]|uniref:hypothetical protein n=1 Tax=Pseudomonas putida TaxID=303 RepID=UPI001A8DD9C0|nr:hypothetical protein [Pseudomonas putida]MBO0368271.1 hypothetical protein [Pseudomonas putida]
MDSSDGTLVQEKPKFIRFFSEPGFASDIGNLEVLARIESLTSANADLFEKFIERSLAYFCSDPEQVDKNCQYNIEQVGGQFKVAVQGIKQKQRGATEALVAMCYRFLVECQLVAVQPLPNDLESLMEKVRGSVLSDTSREHMKYADHNMVINILRSYLHHKEIVAAQALPSLLIRAERLKVEINKDLESRTAEVNDLRVALGEYKTGFNFVGLYNGFKGMRDEKAKEEKTNFIVLIVLAALMALPFLVKIGILLFGGESSETIEADPAAVEAVKTVVVATAEASGKNVAKVPEIAGYVLNFMLFVGAELLALYFFRVALHNFKSVRSQLLQLDLRMTLCQFIQSYAEYGKKMRAGGGEETLAKFEQVIFSGIVGNDTDIPSTFDGLDQMVKILDKVRPA